MSYTTTDTTLCQYHCNTQLTTKKLFILSELSVVYKKTFKILYAKFLFHVTLLATASFVLCQHGSAQADTVLMTEPNSYYCVVPRTYSSYDYRTFAAAASRLWNSIHPNAQSRHHPWTASTTAERTPSWNHGHSAM